MTENRCKDSGGASKGFEIARVQMGSTPNGGKRGRGKGGLGSRDDEWKWKCESERRLETGFLEGAGRASESKQASACATTKRVTGRCVHSLVGRDASLLLLLISRPPFDRHQCCAQNKQNKTKQSSRSSKKKKKKNNRSSFSLTFCWPSGPLSPAGAYHPACSTC